MRALLNGLLAVIVALLAGTEALLPPFLAARVADGLAASTGSAAVEVQMRSFPAYRMLAGDVDRMTVTLSGVKVDGLAVESLRLDAAGVHLDVAGLLRGRLRSQGWPLTGQGAATVEAVVTEAALEEWARAQLPAQVDVQVDVGADGVELRGRTTVLGIAMNVAVQGRVEPSDDGRRLLFVPETVIVGGQALADWVAQGIREMYTAAVDLNAAPVPLVVEEVRHQAGRLVIAGRTRSEG